MADKVQKIREEVERIQLYTQSEVLKQVLDYIDSLQEEPKFKTGDRIKPIDSCLGSPRTIVDVCDSWYVTDQGTLDFEYEDNWEAVEEPKQCMYSKDNYTNEDRKALCDGCEEECQFNQKEEPASKDYRGRYKRIAESEQFKRTHEGMSVGEIIPVEGEEPISEDFKKFEQEYLEKEKDEILCVYDRHAGLIDGAQWQKQQMMKDAIEAEIINWASMFTSIKVIEPERAEAMIKEKFDIGDKVKLIIVKED